MRTCTTTAKLSTGVCVLAMGLLTQVSNAQDSFGRPTVGVQRWDMYAGQNMPTQQQELGYLPGAQGFLKPAEWHYRAPFFARKTEDVTWVNHPSNAGPLWINYPYDSQFVQDTTDQEIDFAADAGIDYFIFNGPTRTLAANGWSLHDNLDAYLASSKRDRINFVQALYGHNGIDYNKTKVDLMLDEIITNMQSSTWQTVKGNRPLLPVLWPKQFEAMLGSKLGSEHMTLSEFVTHIRQRVMAVGLPNPYIVGEEVSDPTPIADELLAAGFDAMTAYAGAYGGALVTSPDDPNMPTYQEATQGMFAKYDADYTPATIDFIPPVVNQHSPFPRQAGTNPVWAYGLPQPGDLAERVQLAFDYIADHPDDIEANTIFMYSWNEYSEGGGLGPTMGQSPDYIPVTDKLDEISTVLGLNVVSAAADLDGDGFVGIADLNIVLGNWNQNVPPGDPLADPSGDGFVGIGDLNIVLGNWNAGTPPISSTKIPEPAALVMFGLGGLAVLRR